MHFGMNVHNLKRMTAMVNVHTTRGYTIARRPTGQGVRQQRMRWPIGDGGASNDGGGAGGGGSSGGGGESGKRILHTQTFQNRSWSYNQILGQTPSVKIENPAG